MTEIVKPCAVVGCKKNADQKAGGARGWCRSHYKRWQRHGDPTGGTTARNAIPAWVASHKAHDEDGCLVWPFARNPAGYATYVTKGKGMSGSKLMCMAAHGEPPTPLHEAAHSCGGGSRGCVNPKHLRWATKLENEADKIAHGTRPRGERQGSSKLTEDDVRAIRADTSPQRQIAEKYGVHQIHVSAIKSGRRWGWLNDEIHEPNAPGVGN